METFRRDCRIRKEVCIWPGCGVFGARSKTKIYKNIERKKLPPSSQLESYTKHIVLRGELKGKEGQKLRVKVNYALFVLNLDDWLDDFSLQVGSPEKLLHWHCFDIYRSPLGLLAFDTGYLSVRRILCKLLLKIPYYKIDKTTSLDQVCPGLK